MSIIHRETRRRVLQGVAGTLGSGALGLWPRLARAQGTPGVTDNEVLIGALGQLSGPFAFIGAPGRDNMQLAIDKLNDAGGINGRKLRMIYEHASTPAESVAAAKKLVENDKVFVLVIASGSTGAAAAADYVRAAVGGTGAEPARARATGHRGRIGRKQRAGHRNRVRSPCPRCS